MRRLFLTLLCLSLPGHALAGAWPRGEGNRFLSTALTFAEDGDIALTGYYEQGRTPRLTSGFDLFVTSDLDVITTISFAKYSLDDEGPDVWSVGAGLGITERTNEFATSPTTSIDITDLELFLRLSVHYGRGLPNGWIAVDASADFGRIFSEDETISDLRAQKLDLTYGYRVHDNLALIAQTLSYWDDNTDGTTLSVGPAWTRGRFTYEAALQGSEDEAAIKLGLWVTF